MEKFKKSVKAFAVKMGAFLLKVRKIAPLVVGLLVAVIKYAVCREIPCALSWGLVGVCATVVAYAIVTSILKTVLVKKAVKADTAQENITAEGGEK